MTLFPGKLKLLRGRDSRRASFGENQELPPHDLSAIILPVTVLANTTTALINRSADPNVPTPGPLLTGTATTKPQLAAQEPGGGGSTSAQSLGSRKSETLWEEAVEALNEEERKAWDSYSVPENHAGHHSIDGQIELIRRARDNLTANQMVFQRSDGRVIIVREKINSVLKVMDKYMAIGSIAIQHSPTITALVWAGVRFGLQLALNEMKTFEELTSALEDIGNIISCCRIYEELYLACNGESARAVVNALPLLYTAVLRFILRVRGYFDMQGLIKRSAIALIPFEVQFQPLMDTMKQRKEDIDKRARVAHEVFVQKNMVDSDKDRMNQVSNLTNKLGSFGTGISTILQHIEANKRREILQWVSVVKCEDHHAEVVKTRLEGTGAWLLQRREIRSWLEAEESSVLWLHGKAGSGKTVLSSRIIDALSATHGSSSPVLFFYCNYKEQPRREANGILRALLKQISGTATAMDPELVSVYERAQSKGFNSTSIDASSNESLFRRALPTFKESYVVIDALDECEVAERKELVMALKRHTALSDYVLKVFVTSRDEKDLVRMLSGASNFRINADDTALDIRPFVEIKVEECINNGEILGGKGNVTPELRQELVHTLVSKADGMFLWVKYQLEHICIQGSEHDLRTQLGKLPLGLDETYGRILGTIDKLDSPMKDWAYKALKWITFAARPLRSKELLQATAVEPGSSTFESSKMTNIGYLIESCCHLVTLDVRQDAVRFVHYSVQEFLQRQPKFSTAEELVARTCITVFGILGSSFQDGNGVFKYAIRYWSSHVQRLSTVSTLEVLPLIRKMFSKIRNFNARRRSLRLGGMPPSDAPAYLAVCSFLGMATVVERFVQDETTGLHVKLYALRAAAAAGNQAMVQLLLESQVDIDAQDGKHGNALQAAAGHGQKEMIKFLLKHGADINAQGGKHGNALQAAAASSGGKVEAVIRLLLGSGADINAQGGEHGNALQAAAASSGRKAEVVIRLLLKNGADIHAQGGRYGNALLAAAHCSRAGALRLLLENDANINSKGGQYGNALQAMAYSGDREMVRLLLEKGADINAQGGEYGNALQAAVACYGGEAMVQLLVENGADINAQGGKFGNALQAAAATYYGEAFEVVRLLLENGADVNAQGGEHGNALQAAAYKGNEVMVGLLLENGADINAQGGKFGNALQAAAATYYGEGFEVVQLLLEKGADINVQGGEYGNALQAAVACYGGEGMVQLLVENGADINAQGGKFGNALQAAAATYYGEAFEVVQLLLENGADINAQGGKFGNALQAAAATYYGEAFEVVRLLLENGADINAQGGECGTALQAAAAYYEGEAIVRLLVENGADINAQGGEHGNALQAAAFSGNKGIVQFLLGKGADIDTQGGRFGNALQAAAAASCGKAEAVVRLLLENGADINAQGGEHGNALQAALASDNKRAEAVVQLLLEKGADINAQGGTHGSALQAAAYQGNEAMVRLMLENGADINAQGKHGSALQAARRNGHWPVTRLLLDNGAESVFQNHECGSQLPAESTGS